MAAWPKIGWFASLALTAAAIVPGCASLPGRPAKADTAAMAPTATAALGRENAVAGAAEPFPVSQTSANVPVAAPLVAAPPGAVPPGIPSGMPEPIAVPSESMRGSNDSGDPFAGQAELPLETLVAEVCARNPSLQAMSAAWRAAAERFPQVVSLDDPMFGFMLGPSGLGHDGGWMVQGSQKFVWARKRKLRGDIATAAADAAGDDVADTRLRLAEASKIAFFDYYLARRELEVNADTIALVQQLREIAKAMYQSNQASEQDVLQAEVELADLESRRLALLREERIAMARINTLLHRAAAQPLPPPPKQIEIPITLPPPEVLAAAAIESRPDLSAQRARIRAEEASISLACKEFVPDVELVGKYDAFMPEEMMRPQLGMNLNVPLAHDRRWAAVRESQARLRQRRAELEDQVDQVHFEVQAAFERLAEGQEVVRLYTDRVLPAATASLKSAQVNYTAGRVDFLRLIEAERQFNGERERYHQAVADFYRRAAELERALGGTLPLAHAAN
jgi:outer membrane protein, heavy metal efflux system